MPQLIVAILLVVLIKLLIDYIKPALPKKPPAPPGDFIDISEKWISADEMPYQKNDRLLNEPELACFHMFQHIVADSRYTVHPHIRLADLVKVPPGTINRQEYQFRINERSVDLVLLEASVLQPLLGINFAYSGDSQRQQISDQFTVKALRTAGLGVMTVNLDNPPGREQILRDLSGCGIIM